MENLEFLEVRKIPYRVGPCKMEASAPVCGGGSTCEDSTNLLLDTVLISKTAPLTSVWIRKDCNRNTLAIMKCNQGVGL